MLLGLVGVSTVSAHGWFGGSAGASPAQIAERQAAVFQYQAGLLGINVDEMKTAWAKGKSLRDIAGERGITDEELRARTEEARKTQMQEHMKILVDSGVITQTQADERLQFMNEARTLGPCGFGKGFHGRF